MATYPPPIPNPPSAIFNPTSWTYGINGATFTLAELEALFLLKAGDVATGLIDFGSGIDVSNSAFFSCPITITNGSVTNTLSATEWSGNASTATLCSNSTNAINATNATNLSLVSSSSATPAYISFFPNSNGSPQQGQYNTSFLYTPSSNTISANLNGLASNATNSVNAQNALSSQTAVSSTNSVNSQNSEVSIYDGSSIYYMTMAQNYTASNKPLSISNGVLYNASQNLLYCNATNSQVSQNATNASNVYVNSSAASTQYFLPLCSSSTPSNQALVSNPNLYYNTGTNTLNATVSNSQTSAVSSASVIAIGGSGSMFLALTQGTSGNFPILTNLPTYDATSGKIVSNFQGTLTGSSSSTSAINLTADSSSGSYQIPFSKGATGSQQLYTNSSFFFDPITQTLTVPFVSGSITSSATTVSLTNTQSNNLYYVTMALAPAPTNNVLHYAQGTNSLTYNPSNNSLSATVANSTSSLQTTSIFATQKSDAVAYPILFSTATGGAAGYKAMSLDSANLLTYTPSSSTLSATNFSGLATSSATSQTTNNVSNASFYLPFVSNSTTSSQALQVAPSISVNPSNGTITATNFNGTASLSNFSDSINVSASSANNSFSVPFLNSVQTGFGYATLQTQSLGGFTFNPSSQTLTCQNFSGLISNATTSAQSQALQLTNSSSNANGYIPFFQSSTGYSQAFTNNNFYYNALTGVLNAQVTQTLAANTTNNVSNSTFYLPFVGSSSGGNQALQVSSTISANPSTSSITASSFLGNATTSTTSSSCSGNSSTATTSTNIINSGLTANQNYPLAYFATNIAGVNQLSSDTVGNHLLFNPNLNQLSMSGDLILNGSGSDLTINSTSTAISCPNATAISFPLANVSATTFTGSLSGNSSSSTVSSSSTLTSGGSNDMFLVLAQNSTGNIALQTNLAKYNATSTILSAPKVSGTTSVTSPLLQTSGDGTVQILDTSLTNSTTMQQVGPKLTSTLTTGGEFFIKTQGGGTVPLATSDAGTSILWNASSGRGESVLVNYQDNGGGVGAGGFDFYNVSTGSNSTKIATIPVTQSAFSSTGLTIPTYNWVNGTISASNSASSTTVSVTSDDSPTVSYPVFSKGVGVSTALYADNTTSPMTYVASTGTLTLPNVVSSLTGNASSASQVLVTTTGSGPAQFLTFSSSTGTNQSLQNNNALTYDPSTGRLTSPSITSSLTGNATQISVTNDTTTVTPQAILFASAGTGTGKSVASNGNWSIIPSTGALVNNVGNATLSLGSSNSTITCLGIGTALNCQNASNINFTSALVTCSQISATTNRNVGWTSGSNWFTVFDTGNTPAVENALTRFVFTTPSITGDTTQFGLTTIGTDGIFSVTNTGAYDIDINLSHTGQGGTIPTLILGIYNTVGPTAVTNCSLTNFLSTQTNPFQYTVTNSFIGVLTAGQTYGIYYQTPVYAGALGNININLNMVKLM